MEKKKIIGSFIIRYEGDSEFFFRFRTNITPWMEIASCSHTSENLEPENLNFEGEYTYVWLLKEYEYNHGFLTITRTNENLYDLVWHDEAKTTIRYYGQGFQLRRTLVGSFWNNELNKDLPEIFAEEEGD